MIKENMVTATRNYHQRVFVRTDVHENIGYQRNVSCVHTYSCAYKIDINQLFVYILIEIIIHVNESFFATFQSSNRNKNIDKQQHPRLNGHAVTFQFCEPLKHSKI